MNALGDADMLQRLLRSNARLSRVLVGVTVLLASAASRAQTSADSFDINRFSNAGEGWFETFYVEEPQSLHGARDQGILNNDTAVLITETAGGRLALVTDQMAYHHIAQGTINSKHWMATF
jgi:hypothetical protein